MEKKIQPLMPLNAGLLQPVGEFKPQGAFREPYGSSLPTALETRLGISRSYPNVWHTVGRLWERMEAGETTNETPDGHTTAPLRKQGWQIESNGITPKSGERRKHHRHLRRNSFGGEIDEEGSPKSKARRAHRSIMVGAGAPPTNVHLNDWREMIALIANATNSAAVHEDSLRLLPTKGNDGEQRSDCVTNASGQLCRKDLIASLEEGMQIPNRTPKPEHAAGLSSLTGPPHFRARAGSSLSLIQNNWIEQVFKRRECSKFIPTNRYPEKCCCGRMKRFHSPDALKQLLQNDADIISSLSVGWKYSGARSDDDMDSRRPLTKSTRPPGEKWTIRKHTVVLPTNAYGTIEFQGGPHPCKAHYLRLNVETDPADIMYLFENVWQMPSPKLIITVHGGMTNFDLQPKLARVFRKGLLKAAKTTGAWIITSGINAGVVRHVAAAIEGSVTKTSARSKIVSIGITPWGLLKKREDLLGEDVVVPYHPHSFSPKGRFTVLNKRHSYFLLVDNGTVGRNGADVILRKRLETYIAEKQKIGGGTRSVPVVCVVLEGGTCTIRAVLDYVTNIPRVPVVVCDGSGRAADLLAFAHQYVHEDGTLPDGIKPQILNLIQGVFGCDEHNAEKLLAEIAMCAQQKHLMTVFRLGEKREQDVDHAILTALLKDQNLSAPDQLALALAWNRVDIARSDIFVLGQDWPKAALENAMMEALINDRVDFVRLLLENGVSMHKFLTIDRLEDLYNTDKGPQNTLYYIVRDVVKVRPGFRYKMIHIGLAIEKLMGYAYKSTYTTDSFKKKYRQRRKAAMGRQRRPSQSSNFSEPLPAAPGPINNDTNMASNMMAAVSSSRALSNHILWRTACRRDNLVTNFNTMELPNFKENNEAVIDIEDDSNMSTSMTQEDDFKYPFSELLLWAVLTKRHEMALCMWQHGEEAMAKALVACRLYKSLAKEAAEDYLEVEICEELVKYAEEFRQLSLELLEHSYQHDDAQTLQLLTYELANWGSETCLSLAVMNNNKPFLAHPCCQILLADLWHGGLRMRSRSNLKVLCGLLFPPSICFIEFKSREELMLQPQTAAEHEDDINDSSSSSSESESSDSDYSSDGDFLQIGQEGDKRKNSSSGSSIHSSNHAGLFQSRRKRTRMAKDKGSNPATSTASAPQVLGNIVNAAAFPLANSTGVPLLTKNSEIGDYHHFHHRDDTPLNVDNKSKPQQSNIRGHGSGEENAYTNDRSKANIMGPNLPRDRPIKLRRKLYEFYMAPITTFWAWTLSFCVFLCCTTYSLLIKTPVDPSPVEWFLFAYVVTFGIEHARKYLMSEPKSLVQKAIHFFMNIWNTLTTIAVITYLIGFSFRLCPSTRDTYGRVILASNSVLWSIKLLDFMSVHPRMGPYITMAAKMVQNMLYVVVLLCVALLAFGLARQSITFPNEEWHWLLVRNIFYKPYYMLYGEVYAGEIDTCGDSAWENHLKDGVSIDNATSESCVPGHWVPPILMTGFLLVANILLMSMLLAIFNNIFDQTDKISKEIWLFQRYRQVMEYESTPFLPPPLTPVYHVWMIIRYVRSKSGCRSKVHNALQPKKNLFDFTLKLFLNEDQVEKLHDFEEDCMEDLAREKEFRKNTSTEERIHRVAERTDMMLVRINDVAAKEFAVKDALLELESRLKEVESQQREMLDYLRQMMKALPAIVAQFGGAALPASLPSGGRIDEEGELSAPDGSANVITVIKEAETAVIERALDPSRFPANNVEEVKGRKSPSLFVPGKPGKKRIRTSTVTGCDGLQSTRSSTDRGNPRFGSLASLDPTALNQIISSSQKHRSPCSSVRHARRHDEYTSITDAINLSDILPQLTKVLDEDRKYGDKEGHSTFGNNTEVEDEEMVDDEDDGNDMGYQRSETPTTTLQRAKKSFIIRQNTVLKEYEEEIAERLRDAVIQQSSVSAVEGSIKSRDEYDEMQDESNLTESELKENTFDDEEDNSSKEFIEFEVNMRSESASVSSIHSTSSQLSSNGHHKLHGPSKIACSLNIPVVGRKVDRRCQNTIAKAAKHTKAGDA